jgi:hypothetical protein
MGAPALGFLQPVERFVPAGHQALFAHSLSLNCYSASSLVFVTCL